MLNGPRRQLAPNSMCPTRRIRYFWRERENRTERGMSHFDGSRWRAICAVLTCGASSGRITLPEQLVVVSVVSERTHQYLCHLKYWTGEFVRVRREKCVPANRRCDAPLGAERRYERTRHAQPLLRNGGRQV
jgi:hypothetical protein